MIGAKPFINLMKRAQKCHYKTLLMHNRMLMQCYNLDVDSTVGLHYILPIPDTEDYDHKFYDMELVLNPGDIIKEYGVGHKIADAVRKELKVKPKELVEEIAIDERKHHVRLKFMYFVSGDLVTSSEVTISYSDSMSIDSMNLEKTYNNLMERIKVGGAAKTVDGRWKNLQNRIIECPEIYFYKMKLGETKLRVPFSKSTFAGLTKLKKFEFTVLETELPDIYVYAITLGKDGLEDIYWGYLLNY